MHTSGRPRSAHRRCTCSHRGPVGSPPPATPANPLDITRQHPPQPLPPRVPPPVTTRQPVTLAHRTSSLVAPGTPSPHYRTRRTSPPQPHPAERAPLARCPITTPTTVLEPRHRTLTPQHCP